MSTPDQLVDVDIYLNSEGGFYESHLMISSLLERSELPINLIAAGSIMSSAFLIFYMTNRVNKLILPDTTALLHRVSRIHEDRDLKKMSELTRFLLNDTNIINDKILTILKENPALKSKIKKYEGGHDIPLTYDELKKVMLKCPFGNLLL